MNRKVNYIFPQKITWFVPVFDFFKKKNKPKMSKFKSRLLPYSPSQNMTPMETSLESPGEEPDSPVSSASLIFDGVQWQLPLSQSDMEVENFHPPLSSSPKITLGNKQGKYTHKYQY